MFLSTLGIFTGGAGYVRMYIWIVSSIDNHSASRTPQLQCHVPCHIMLWASYQIRNIAGCACAGNAGNVFTRRRLQRKQLVSDPGMHHGTCVTHVPWCMSGSLASGGGENVPGIPGACAPAIFCIWQEAHWNGISWPNKYLILQDGGWIRSDQTEDSNHMWSWYDHFLTHTFQWPCDMIPCL